MPPLNLKRLRDSIRAKIDELQITLKTLDEMDSSTRNGHVRGLDIAEEALAQHRKHRRPLELRKKIGRPPGSKTKNKTPRLGARSQGKPLPDVDVPAGLSLEGQNAEDAIPLALRAFERPATSAELTALLFAGGWKMPPQVVIPPARYVGLVAAGLKRQKKVYKSAKGWGTR
jgi:hypothetical protein